jgi:hypothetical protein
MPAVLILSLQVDGHRRQQEKPHSQCASIPQLTNERRFVKCLNPPEGRAQFYEQLQQAVHGGITAALEPDPPASAEAAFKCAFQSTRCAIRY